MATLTNQAAAAEHYERSVALLTRAEARDGDPGELTELRELAQIHATLGLLASSQTVPVSGPHVSLPVVEPTVSEKRRRAAARGNHARWHTGPTAKPGPDCPLCKIDTGSDSIANRSQTRSQIGSQIDRKSSQTGAGLADAAPCLKSSKTPGQTPNLASSAAAGQRADASAMIANRSQTDRKPDIANRSQNSHSQPPPPAVSQGRAGRPAAARVERPSPAELNTTATRHPDAYRLVTEWAAHNPGVLTSQRRKLAKAVDDLLSQQADPALIPAALDEAHRPGWTNPVAVLPSTYDRVRRDAHPSPTAPNRNGGVDRVPTTTARVAAIQALKRGTGEAS